MMLRAEQIPSVYTSIKMQSHREIHIKKKKKKQTNDVQDIVYYTHKLVLQKYTQTYRPTRMITKRKGIEYHSIAR